MLQCSVIDEISGAICQIFIQKMRIDTTVVFFCSPRTLKKVIDYNFNNLPIYGKTDTPSNPQNVILPVKNRGFALSELDRAHSPERHLPEAE